MRKKILAVALILCRHVADEVIVLDSFSSDNTVTIARQKELL